MALWGDYLHMVTQASSLFLHRLTDILNTWPPRFLKDSHKVWTTKQALHTDPETVCIIFIYGPLTKT